jgi:hypothetical protein
LWDAAKLGSTSAKALARRKTRIDTKIRGHAGELGEDYRSEEEEEIEGVDSFKERFSYDPRLVSKESTAWLSQCRSLGFNPNAPGISKYVRPNGGHRSCNVSQTAYKNPGTSSVGPGHIMIMYASHRL